MRFRGRSLPLVAVRRLGVEPVRPRWQTERVSTGARSILVLVLCAGACNAKDAAEARIKVFVDRHGPHMKAIAHEVAPRCPTAFASMSPDGAAAVPGSSEPPTALPFGSLVQDQGVLQVAVICSKGGAGGPIVASLHDPFAEGGAALPPDGCTELEVPTSGGDTILACYDPRRASRTSVSLRHPIEGGVVEVMTIFKLTRK